MSSLYGNRRYKAALPANMGKMARRSKYTARTKTERAAVVAARRGIYRTGGVPRYRRAMRAQTEVKYDEGIVNNFTALTTGNLCLDTLVGRIVQGTNADQRIGSKILLKKVMLQGQFILPNNPNSAITGAAGVQADEVRLIVVQDKQFNGTAANLNEIYSAPVDAGQPPGNVDTRAFRYMPNIQRFKILRDMRVSLNNGNFTNGSGSAAQTIRQFSMYISCNIPIEYQGVGTSGQPNLATIRSNNVLVYACSSQGLILCNFVWRVRYVD